MARESESGKSEKSEQNFWAKTQLAKEKNLWNINTSSSGDAVADYVSQNFGGDMFGGSSSKANPYITPVEMNFGASNMFATNDANKGYTSLANLGQVNGVHRAQVTYHYAEGEREQFRAERNAIAFERLRQNMPASTAPTPAYQTGLNWLSNARTSDQAQYNANVNNATSGTEAALYSIGRAFNHAGYDIAQGATGLFGLAADDNLRRQTWMGLTTAVGKTMLHPIDTATGLYKSGANYYNKTSIGQMSEDVLRFGAGGLATAGMGKVVQMGASPVLRGGEWLVEKSYVNAQDYAVKTWLRSQSNDLLGGSWQQVYDSASDTWV